MFIHIHNLLFIPFLLSKLSSTITLQSLSYSFKSLLTFSLFMLYSVALFHELSTSHTTRTLHTKKDTYDLLGVWRAILVYRLVSYSMACHPFSKTSIYNKIFKQFKMVSSQFLLIEGFMGT